MANVPIVEGTVFRGDLNMFGTVYDYFLTIDKAENGILNFSHKLMRGSFIEDQKSGEGKYTQLDDNNYEIEYQDPETLFKGVFKPDEGTFVGLTNQIGGFLIGAAGSFDTKVYIAEQ